MRPVIATGGLGVLALLLIGAAPQLSPEDLVRQGNEASARQEYDLAVQLYSKAEETITNPGLVAFNKGTALYRLGRYREAQIHFQRCQEEAGEARQAALLYNLGNCLLQQAQAGSDLTLFREAIDAYQRCLRQEDSAADLRANARYNLELAKLLWLQARLTRPEKETPNTETPPEPPRPEKNQPEMTKTDDGQEPNPSAKPNAQEKNEKRGQVNEKKGKQTPIETDKNAPGHGNIQPPADDAQLKPLAPEDAIKNLEAAAERIRRERGIYLQRIAPLPLRGVPDW